ncbi:hypothetical protein Thermo_01834 [Thermoplasmatales archaeon]|nr:hypothetical protein Thermo_01834 [Thermoplasmatales archaeon]
MSRNTNRNRKKKQHYNQREADARSSSARRRKARILITASILVALIVTSVAVYKIEFVPKGSSSDNTRSSSYPASLAGFSRVSSFPSLIGGKIPIIFVGSIACPYCAAVSWSIYSSLTSGGGSWSGLAYVSSNSTDIYPDTPGLNFANASYSSSTIAFYGYETSNRNWQPYQSMNATDQYLFSEYDPSGHIPFILIGGLYLHIGGFYPPSVLANASCSTLMSWLTRGTGNAITENIHNVSVNITSVITYLESQPATQLQANPFFAGTNDVSGGSRSTQRGGITGRNLDTNHP